MTTEATNTNDTAPATEPLAISSSDGLGAGAEAPYLASTSRTPGRQRFSVQGKANGRWIDDDDFIFDAMLEIRGDFGDDTLRARYAQWICDALNEADKTLPREPRSA